MPNTGFPQYYGARLVEFANFYSTGTPSPATYTASAGDIVVCTGTTAGTQAVVLPAVALGGPVTVINANGTTAAGTVTVFTTDSSTIDGVAGATGVILAPLGASAATTANIANQCNRNTFASNGTSWFRVF
jgi:hypothetical protein